MFGKAFSERIANPMQKEPLALKKVRQITVQDKRVKTTTKGLTFRLHVQAPFTLDRGYNLLRLSHFYA